MLNPVTLHQMLKWGADERVSACVGGPECLAFQVAPTTIVLFPSDQLGQRGFLSPAGSLPAL